MFRVSERFARRVMGQHRSTQRHATKVVDIEEAKLRRRHQMVYRVLRREGWLVKARHLPSTTDRK